MQNYAFIKILNYIYSNLVFNIVQDKLNLLYTVEARKGILPPSEIVPQLS